MINLITFVAHHRSLSLYKMSNTTNGQTGLSVIVVGAGIAGLAVATGLAQKGHAVTVVESKPALNEFGASIGILPNGVRVLDAVRKLLGITPSETAETWAYYTQQY